MGIVQGHAVPEELAIEIFGNLSARQLAEEWERLASDPVLWQRICHVHFAGYFVHPSRFLLEQLGDSWKRNYRALRRWKRTCYQWAGDSHSCAILDDGRMYIWGMDQYERRGKLVQASCMGSRRPLRLCCDSLNPRELPSACRFQFAYMCLHQQQIGGITKDGEIYVWGRVGLREWAAPRRIALTLAGDDERPVQLAFPWEDHVRSSSGMLAVTNHGRLFKFNNRLASASETKIPAIYGKIHSFAVGAQWTILLTLSDAVLLMYNTVSSDDESLQIAQPRIHHCEELAQQGTVCVGSSSVTFAALTECGQLWVTGFQGALFEEHSQDEPYPPGEDPDIEIRRMRRLHALKDLVVRSFGMNDQTLVVSTDAGGVYTVGWSLHEQNTWNYYQPETWAALRVKELDGVHISFVSVGFAHALAFSSEGSVYGFGSNCNAELGLGCSDPFAVPPTRIPKFSLKTGRRKDSPFHTLLKPYGKRAWRPENFVGFRNTQPL